MSCQIFIRRKLAGEIQFFQNKQVKCFFPLWAVPPSLSLSPALISSTVIYSRLNAISEKPGIAFHSHSLKNKRNKKKKSSSTRALSVRSVVWKRRSPFCVVSWEWPRSLPSPARRHWRKPVLNLQAWSHQNNICVFGLQFCAHGWKENWEGGRNERKHSRSKAQRCQSRLQPTQDSFGRQGRGQQGVDDAGFEVTAQQVITITMCSLGGLSVI